MKALTDIMSIEVSEVVGPDATASIEIGVYDDSRHQPADISVVNKEVCKFDGAGWAWALLTWAMAHTVFAIKPKPRHQALLLLVQDLCLKIKERPLPERAAKVVAFLVNGDA